MNAADVLDFYNQLTDRGIKTWLDGGWAVDALLGEETRSHEDVDIVIAQKDVPKLRDLLVTQGYKDVLRDDTSAWNFVLGDDKGHRIDVHVIVIDDKGNGMYGPIKKGEVYPAASLTGMGTISGHPVKCISAEYLVKFHAGYELDDNDRKDIAALCTRFGIEYMSIHIVPLEESTYEEAVRIAVEGNTGQEKDIRSRLKSFKEYFVAVKDSHVIGEIGWYQDDGSFAGKALGDKFPVGKDIYWLGHFAVESAYRGYGIGGLLLQHLEKVVKELGGRELWAYTSQARGFYEKKKFVFVQKAWIDEHWEDVLKKVLS